VIIFAGVEGLTGGIHVQGLFHPFGVIIMPPLRGFAGGVLSLGGIIMLPLRGWLGSVLSLGDIIPIPKGWHYSNAGKKEIT